MCDTLQQFHWVEFEQSSLTELSPLGVSSVVTDNVAHVLLIERTRSQRQVLLIQYASALYLQSIARGVQNVQNIPPFWASRRERPSSRTKSRGSHSTGSRRNLRSIPSNNRSRSQLRSRRIWLPQSRRM